jgi:hypothetical protein
MSVLKSVAKKRRVAVIANRHPALEEHFCLPANLSFAAMVRPEFRTLAANRSLASD